MVLVHQQNMSIWFPKISVQQTKILNIWDEQVSLLYSHELKTKVKTVKQQYFNITKILKITLKSFVNKSLINLL